MESDSLPDGWPSKAGQIAGVLPDGGQPTQGGVWKFKQKNITAYFKNKEQIKFES